MKIKEITEKLGNVGKNKKSTQSSISISEAHYLLITVISRYDAYHLTNILEPQVKDEELKRIVQKGLGLLEQQINTLEKLLNEFNIPMPDKPPENVNLSVPISTINDKTIFRLIHTGMKTSLMTYLNVFRQSPMSYIRESLRGLLNKEMEAYDMFYEYGKLKAYLHESPPFRP